MKFTPTDRRTNQTRALLNDVEAGVASKKSHAEIGADLNLARSRVSNLARLLSLPHAVMAAVRNGRIAPKTAEALLPLKSEQRIVDAFHYVVAHQLSASDAREYVKELLSSRDPRNSADVSALERAMSEQLAARVTITKVGKGYRLTIDAADLDCVDGVVQRLGIEL